MNQTIVLFIVLPVAGFVLGWIIRWLYARFQLSASEQKAERVKQDAIKEAEAQKKEILLEAKEQLIRERNQQERENRERRAEVQRYEARVSKKEELVDKRAAEYDKKEQDFSARVTTMKHREEAMDAKEAISLYKSRDGSEKLFRGDKSYLGEKSLRVRTDERMDSKIFIEFIALIVRNRIYRCLKEKMKAMDKKPNYMTVPAALKELEKIEMVRLTDNVYHLDHAVTATQKTILEAFGLDPASATEKILETLEKKK
mgnify:CR=1 FL=1